MALGIFHCQLLMELHEKVHFVKDEDELSRLVLEQVAKHINVGGGTIYKFTAGDKIAPLASVGVDINLLRQLEFRYGEGVVGWIAKYHKPVKLDDIQADGRFAGKVDAITGLKVKSVVAAPILLKGQAIGAIELVNKIGIGFTQVDLELVTAIGKELGTIFENVSLIKDLQRSQTYLNAIVNSLNAGLLVIDVENNMQIVNPRAAQILKIESNQMQAAKKNISDLASAAPQALSLLRAALEEKKMVPRGQAKVAIGGNEVVLGYSATPIKNEKGDYAGMTFLFQDITSYQKA